MTNKPEFTQLPHVGLLVSDTRRALDFYCGLLGFAQLERPALPYPGAWLAVGAQQIHLMELPRPDSLMGRPEHGGRDRHIALLTDSVAGLQQLFEEAGIEYTASKSGRAAIFCRDPDGNALEFVQGTPRAEITDIQ